MSSVDRLTFVYDADGTLVGEARYWLGTLVRVTPHCSLCDLTHSRWRKRPAFRRCAEQLGIPIEYLHRDDLDDATRAIAGDLPVVLAHRGDEISVLLGRSDLAALDGDVDAFQAAVTTRLSVG